MTKANRGPSYLRVGPADRAGHVETPRPASSEAPGDPVQRQLQRWQAPILPDEEIEFYAKLFLMRPGHELIPFFLWMDAARIELRSRPLSSN
jgi:hypothetical protein